ncbi:MAG: hypothetical protein ABDH23_00900 [Endomicrobiia bacterium]
MKKKCLKITAILVLIFSLLISNLFSSSWSSSKNNSCVIVKEIHEQEDVDSLVFTSKRKVLTKKSPFVALFLALVPGFFIHGLGHFYAGKPLIGSVLLICGVVGTVMLITGIVMVWFSGAILSPGIIVSILTGTNIFVSETVTGMVLGVELIKYGSILFIGSWWIDIIGAYSLWVI